MKNVLEYLEQNLIKFSDKTAVIEENNKYSYENLINTSKAIGSAILRFSPNKKPIPVFMEKGFKSLTTFFGAVYAGAPYSLLNTEFPQDRLNKILNTLESEIIITDNEHIEKARDFFQNVKILLVEELMEETVNETELTNVRRSALDIDPLYINFTSGSTGKPKGVVVDHQTVINFITTFTEKFCITSNDIIGNQAPFDFDVSAKDIYSTIMTGATLVIIPKKMFSRPAELLDYICDSQITTLIWAVSALCLITTFHGLDYKIPQNVNKIMFSGEVMPIKHIKQWIEKLPNTTFVNLYGPTEITCNCTYHIVDKQLKYEKQIPIGKPFNNEEVFLLDDNNKKVINTDEIGEICVKGSTLALGYYNNLELTHNSFIQNPLNNKYIDLIYKTGDLGYLDNNGDLNFAGRKDFQIKHMSHRIELEDIERTMEKIEEVNRACCIYYEEKSKIYSFYIGRIDAKNLKQKLKNILPAYMIPNVIKNVNEFPITKNGKIDRNLLLQSEINKK